MTIGFFQCWGRCTIRIWPLVLQGMKKGSLVFIVERWMSLRQINLLDNLRYRYIEETLQKYEAMQIIKTFITFQT